MLKKVLQEMSTGDVYSRADLARRLGVSEGLLAQMIKDLVRKGYLAPLATALDCGSCSGCNGCKACNCCGSSEATMPKGWALTAKGIEMAKRYPQ
jgi:predicted metal-binding protein